MAKPQTVPHDLDAEKSVLAAILLRSDALALIAGSLKPSDFFRHAHQQIYFGMLQLVNRNVVVDFITLCDELRRVQQLDAVGGPAYLSGLTDGVARSSNIEHHARLVRDKSLLRALINAADTIREAAYAATAEAVEVLATAEGSIYGLGDREAAGMLVDGATMAQEGMALLQRLRTTGKLSGLPTGLSAVDEATLGLHPAHLTVVAARPGRGKSAYMLHLARQIGITQHKPAAVFSLEMSREELVLRIMAAGGNTNASRLNSGYADATELTRIGGALVQLEGSQLYVDDTPGRSILEIRSQCRRLIARAGGLAVILIDYLQLMRPVIKKSANREQEVSELAWGCKHLAKEFNVPVILLSQLNRDVEQRAGGRPQLSDLRESGAVEQHADDVLFVHPPATPDGTAELIIGKQRSGPTATVTIGYDPAKFRFWTLAQQAP